MGKKNKKPKTQQENVIIGSGAEVVSHKDEQGRVKCKCIVPCVWRGYRDEGDTVWIEKELVEKDAFIRMHFKAVPLPEGQRRQDGDEGGEGDTQSQETEHNDNADGDGETAADGDGESAADGEGETAADGEGENGQGELGLK